VFFFLVYFAFQYNMLPYFLPSQSNSRNYKVILEQPYPHIEIQYVPCFKSSHHDLFPIVYFKKLTMRLEMLTKVGSATSTIVLSCLSLL